MQQVLINRADITAVVNLCLSREVHFVAYKAPGDSTATVIIQKSPEVIIDGNINQKFPGKGFLIAPFSKETDDTWLIRPDIVIHDTIQAHQLSELSSLPAADDPHKNLPAPDDTGKNDYINLINESIKQINAGEFEKVVLSRVKSVRGNFRPSIARVFSALCETYPNAFVYLFNVKGQCWTGATPEPFVCSEKNVLKTVSLAGTRNSSESNLDIEKWNKKELQEQEYVTLHIEETLKRFNIEPVKSGPYVAKAGNLLHLRTDFTFTTDAIGGRLPLLISSLHPTPAICGMSTGKAMDFIKTGEKHDRAYYAGFLGPIGIPENIMLYVNLRCMQVFDDRLVLYIGGGITGDSVPEEEWEETEMKAETLLSVLKKIG